MRIAVKKVLAASLPVAVLCVAFLCSCAVSSSGQKEPEQQAADSVEEDIWMIPVGKTRKSAGKAGNKESESVLLHRGTEIKLKLLEFISSQDDTPGQEVDYEVMEDVKVEDTVVIKAGARAKGSILSVIPARGNNEDGYLKISAEKVYAVDGTEAPLGATLEAGNRNSAGKSSGGLFSGGFKGKEARINRSEKIEVFIAADVWITPGETMESKGKATAAGKACFKICEDSPDGFKACMNKCNGFRDLCTDLSTDQVERCLVKCMK